MKHGPKRRKTSRATRSGLAVTRREPGSWAETVPDVVLAVHGGMPGPRKDLIPGDEEQIRAALEKALRAGYAKIDQGSGDSLSAVEAAVRELEDAPIFNAGRGAVPTADGRFELDASIMEGLGKKAGAVANVGRIKNPITAARAVMEKSQHVLLAAEGAVEFARAMGLEMVEQDYFRTQRRWEQYQAWLEQAGQEVRSQFGTASAKKGTVGAVAVDRKKTVAAGTSTGGLMGKRYGRVGDSPIIGAGTYADNAAAAVSATGWGEYFIRFATAFNIVSRMKLLGQSVGAAADAVINGEIKQAGGEGGVIALTPGGVHAAAFNGKSMARGYITRRGEVVTAIDDR